MPPCLDLEVVALGLESVLPSAVILGNATHHGPQTWDIVRAGRSCFLFMRPHRAPRCCLGNKPLLGLSVPGTAGLNASCGMEADQVGRFPWKVHSLSLLAKMGALGLLAPFSPFPARVAPDSALSANSVVLWFEGRCQGL